VRELVARLERNTSWSVEGRLSEILLSRHSVAAGKAFKLGVRQAQLAEELGTVREVLVRTLALFCRDGLISRERRGWYRVRDLERLRLRAK
jgi:CRP-like cAMP-binding protein